MENLISLSFPGLTVVPFPFQPYIFHCSFATPYNFKFQRIDEFCINSDLSPGSSGSPIISIRNENGIHKYTLLGTFYYEFADYHSVDSVALDTIKSSILLPVFDTAVIIDSRRHILKGYGTVVPLHLGRVIKADKIMELLKR
jgi:hypothetical protein